MSVKRIGQNKFRIKISVRVPFQSEPVKKQETFKGTKVDAELRESELVKKIKSRLDFSSSLKIKTFSQALELYTTKKEITDSSKLSIYKKLDYALGHLALYEIPEKLEEYLNFLKTSKSRYGRPYKKSYINVIIVKVNTVFNFLKNMNYIEYNPINQERCPKYKKIKPRDRYYTIEERERMLEAIKKYRPYLYPFINYSLQVPCRKMELVNAKREQYDFFSNTIYIPDSKSGDPITKPVPPNMVEYFKNIPKECEYLFYRKDKKGVYHKLGNFFKAWKYCLRKAGIENGTVHDCRHASATDLYNSGITERKIMDIAGWKTPMLSTYRNADSKKTSLELNEFFKKKEDNEEDNASIVAS